MYSIDDCGEWNEAVCGGFDHYNAGDGCDCGCGSFDPDCEAAYCTEVGCEEPTCDWCEMVGASGDDAGGPAIERTLCGTWTCDDKYFGDGGLCDCGCGAIDPDCDAGGCASPDCMDSGCDVCRDGSGQMIRCYVSHCTETTFEDGYCDCGCGAPDPDCVGFGCIQPGCMADSCEVCRDPFGRQVPCL